MASTDQSVMPRLIKGYAAFEDGVLMLIFASTLGFAVMQILLRNFFDIGLIWLESYLRMQVLWLAMLGAMVATREGEHIRIDLLARFIQGKLIRYFDGAVAVLAWETGCNEGPAGWDWLHYMIQRGSLVDNRSASETLKLCREWAKSGKGKSFLDEAGWVHQTELWIGTYLAYSSWIAGFDRDELLSSWMVNQRLDS